MKEETLGKILSQSPVFSGASHDTLARLCSCNVRGFRGGETIYSPASFFRGIGIVISGTLAVHGKNGERDILLRTIDKGGIFGAAALFGGNGEYVSTVSAKKKSEVLFVPEETLSEIFMLDSGVSLAYIRFLSERIRFLNGKITGFSTPDTESAVALSLLSAMPESGGEFSVNASRMSYALGIGRASVYRAFASLSEDGIITYGNGRVTVLDKARLYGATRK